MDETRGDAMAAMDDARRIGRFVGAMLLVKMFAGPIENFALMGKVVAPPDGFLVNAAANPLSIPLAVMLSFVLCLTSIAILAVAYPLFRQRAPQLALWFLVLTVVGVATSLVEGVTMMSMQSLSLAHAAAGGATPELYQGLKGVVGAARNWAHYTNLIVGGLGLLVMFLLWYRARLVPRLLAGAAMATVPLQLYSLGRPFFGAPVVFELMAPIGIAMLASMVWLLWKGFASAPAAA